MLLSSLFPSLWAPKSKLHMVNHNVALLIQAAWESTWSDIMLVSYWDIIWTNRWWICENVSEGTLQRILKAQHIGQPKYTPPDSYNLLKLAESPDMWSSVQAPNDFRGIWLIQHKQTRIKQIKCRKLTKVIGYASYKLEWTSLIDSCPS